MGGYFSKKLITMLLVPFEIVPRDIARTANESISTLTVDHHNESSNPIAGQIMRISNKSSSPVTLPQINRVLVHFERVKIGFWYRDKELTARLVVRRKHDIHSEVRIPIFEKVKAMDQVRLHRYNGTNNRPKDQVLLIKEELSNYEARLEALVADGAGTISKSYDVQWQDLDLNGERSRRWTFSAPPFVKYFDIKFIPLKPTTPRPSSAKRRSNLKRRPGPRKFSRKRKRKVRSSTLSPTLPEVILEIKLPD